MYPFAALVLAILAPGVADDTFQVTSPHCVPRFFPYMVNGEAGDRLGHFLAGLGDVNRDGVPDFAAGAPGSGPAGAVLVLSGVDGSVVFRLDGTTDFPMGESGAFAGDVNADGTPDLILGSPDAGTGSLHRAGKIRVYSGLDGTLLYEKAGTFAFGQMGRSVAGPGDFNRDGYDDFAAGVPGTSENRVIVWSGANGSTMVTHRPPNNVIIDFGYSMDRVGDINGGGVPELLFGAPLGHGPGFMLGGQTWLMNGLQYSLLHDLNSSIAFAQMGTSVAGAGDVDGDGVIDVVSGGIGAGGHVFVYSGADGTVIYHTTGTAGTNYGGSTEGPGDLDGDGYAEFMVGAYGVDGTTTPGIAYVYSGADGQPLLRPQGAQPWDEVGRGLAGIGDITGDGRPDIAIGAPRSDFRGMIDAGIILVISIPAPCLRVSAIPVNRAVCSVDSVAFEARIANCTPVELLASIPAHDMPEFLLQPGEERVFDLTMPMPPCDNSLATLTLTAVGRHVVCEDSVTTAAVMSVYCEDCLLPDCPRRAEFWEKQCDPPGNTEPVVSPAELADIAACVDALSTVFEWDSAIDSFCATLEGTRPSSFESAAKREFAALLANVCATYEPNLYEPIRMRQTTPLHLDEFPGCGTLECVADAMDSLLAAAKDLPESEARNVYRLVSSTSGSLNAGRNVGETCGRRDLKFEPDRIPDVRIATNPLFGGRALELTYTLPEDALVEITMFDVAGRLVDRLAHEVQPAGEHVVSWNPAQRSARVPDGIYFVHCRIGGRSRSLRIVVAN